MQTTPETRALLDELYDRSTIVAELDGPQVEAWVSGLFAVFDDEITPGLFVTYCAEKQTSVGAVLCAAIAELAGQIDETTATAARDAVLSNLLPPTATQIGSSQLTGAWCVRAPFGRSIVLGFDNPTEIPRSDSGQLMADDEVPVELEHSILVEIGENGGLEDLQLSGPAKVLLEEATASDRVVVEDIDITDALDQVVAGWPSGASQGHTFGPGLAANQQFVRRRIFVATGLVLAPIEAEVNEVDVRRGLSDEEYDEANRASRSTLQAALGISAEPGEGAALTEVEQTLVKVIRGDAGDLSPRERDALLWLEWADWLGVGIGLVRAGAGSPADGATFVDLVNRCPEVSSTIDKADRDYAEWAFELALDLLADVGAVEDGRLTDVGHHSMGTAMMAAWS